MTSVRHKLGVSLILSALAVPLAVVSVAYACGHLVTLYIPAQAHQGAKVSGWGSGYSITPGASPVTIHFNGRNGAVLWSGRPNTAGAIYPSFTAPNVRSGFYVLLTEQSSKAGVPQAGTPGRAAIYIGAHRPRHAAIPAAWVPTGAGGSGPRGSTATSGLSLGTGSVLAATLLSGALLGSGVLLLRSGRRRRGQSLAA